MARAKNAEPEIGDNSDGTNVAAEELRAFLERIERLEEEKKTINDDVKDVYGEAKGRGYDTKVIRKIVALRKRDQSEVDEENAIFELYAQALGIRTTNLV